MTRSTETTSPTPGSVAELTRVIGEQRSTIDALIAAADRRTANEPDSAAIATWQRNLTLQRRVAERTDRVRVAEQLLRSVIDSLDVGLCILAAAGTIIDTNRVWQQMLGIGGDRGVADQGSILDLAGAHGGGVGELLRETAGAVDDVLAGRRPRPGTERAVLAGNEERWWKTRVDRVRGHDAGQAVVTLTDVTRQVRIQEKLRQATRMASRLALVAEHMDDAVVIADTDGVIEWVNAAFTQISGFSTAEAVGRTRASLVPTGQPFPSIDESRAEQPQSTPPEVRTTTKGGRPYWLKVELFRVVDDDGVVRHVSVERDVTARIEADQTLLEAVEHAEALAQELSTEKAVLTGVISSIPHLTYWKDFAGRYHGHNAAFLAFRGVDPGGTLVGRTEQELDFVDDLSAILADIEQQVLHSGQPVVDRHITITGTDGTRAVLMSVLPQPDAEGQVGGLIGIGADVTRVSELERQLNQANRLEAIGQLAAGVAHEINTPIQFVSDNTRFVAQSCTQLLSLVQTVSQYCDPAADNDPATVIADLGRMLADINVGFLAEEIPAALTESLEGLERVAQIVRAMKDFSHPGQGRGAIDLNRAIESTVQVARNEWKYHATLDLNLGPDVGLVPCYEGEFKQVILNLIVNATHAIEARGARDEGGLGQIRIGTTRFDDRVEIAIADDGTGMDTATQQRIFDPFFTTKEVGKGTGQGLSMAYASIVQKHGGSLRVESAPGAGSTFTIVLPAYAEAGTDLP